MEDWSNRVMEVPIIIGRRNGGGMEIK